MQKVLCGIDLGGTKLSVGLVNREGGLVDTLISHDHVTKNEEGVVAQMVDSVRALLMRNGISERDLLGIGVGVAGHLRYRDGIIITTSNLRGFKNYPLRDKLQRQFKTEVLVDNDANAQAYGEFKYGAGVGYDDMLFVTLSTGIGAGIILGGKLYRGMTGTAGEIGHTIVDPGTDLVCTCGNRGCLIAVASGLAIPAVFRKRLDEGHRSSLADEPGFDIERVDGASVKRGLDANDPVCMDIVNSFADYLGIGFYNLFQVFNPQAIVVGGGLLNWGEEFFDRITRRFYELARDMLFDKIAIVPARIGATAGIVGAASLLLEAT